MAEPKSLEPKVRPIAREHAENLYSTLEELMAEHHADDLENARVGLAWHAGWHPDVDGRLNLAKTRRLSELDQRMIELDFIVELNQDVWPELSETQVKAVLDHECCHMAPKITPEGDQEVDTTGRYVWRIRKHEVEEFPEVVERHGVHNQDLEALAKAIMLKKAQGPLFEKVGDEDEKGDADKAHRAVG